MIASGKAARVRERGYVGPEEVVEAEAYFTVLLGGTEATEQIDADDGARLDGEAGAELPTRRPTPTYSCESASTGWAGKEPVG